MLAVCSLIIISSYNGESGRINLTLFHECLLFTSIYIHRYNYIQEHIMMHMIHYIHIYIYIYNITF